ncbi:MAG: response regulator transcription factor [Firmicutes bacterium]|nr:response regulator transcription factor [Bacillota bacterium]
MYSILVCDDDRDIVNALKIYLEGDGYSVIPAYSGHEAVNAVREQNIDLALLDIMMPGMDGLEATRALREFENIPIILITAKSEDSDKVLGLNVGADDYITKPFSPTEVLARVRSHLRRYNTLGGRESGASRTVGGDVYTLGGITLDDGAKSVTVDGDPVSLTPIEYSILLLFMRNPGHVFSTTEIYSKVWSEPSHSASYGGDGTVPVHIRHIREKIEIDPANPRYLKAVWGHGYKLGE